VVAEYNVDESLIQGDKLNLVKAVINKLRPKKNDQGLDIFLHSDAPLGQAWALLPQ